MQAGDCILYQKSFWLLIEVEQNHALGLPIKSGTDHRLLLSSNDLASGALPYPLFYPDLSRMTSLELGEIFTVIAIFKPTALSTVLKALILRQTEQFSAISHKAQLPGNQRLAEAFVPGVSSIPYAGRVFSKEEVTAAVSSTLDFWLTLGPEGQAFEEEFATWLGVKYTVLVNSGSSANLIALAILTSHKVPEQRRLVPGDEVITCAAGFPTTVAPILQLGLVPVFIDSDPVTGNVRADQLESAYIPGKTKVVILAHTLGNPFDLGTVLKFCHLHDLWLIEDNCDALGATYSLPATQAKTLGLDHLLSQAEEGRTPLIRYEMVEGANYLTAPTGTWGDLSTQSFYPAHHLTMGEGGAVNIVSRGPFKFIAESFRDWGRDCWCPSGKDNTCGKRFDWQLGELPHGYDHKYIYSHLGYNLKPLDPQAAIGRAQLKRLDYFIEARRQNWKILRKGLADLEHVFSFSLPTHAVEWNSKGFLWDNTAFRTNSSWFGFMIRLQPNTPFSRRELSQYLDEKKIGHRMLFGGNLVRQPVFVQLKKDRPQSFRVIGNLTGADEIMNQTLFLGTYPGLTLSMLDYMIEALHVFTKTW